MKAVFAVLAAHLIALAHAGESIDVEHRVRIGSVQEETIDASLYDHPRLSVSNEYRIDLFYPRVADLMGGYVGVGTTQNLDLVAHADSEWAWLLDNSKRVVATNRLHLTFVAAAATPERFVQLWGEDHSAEALELIRDRFSGAAQAYHSRVWRDGHPYQTTRLATERSACPAMHCGSWLNDAELYERLRDKVKRGRIFALQGDLNGPVTMRSIARTASDLGVPIRVFYVSNVEEHWARFESDYVSNVVGLPVDDSSVLLRTVSPTRHGLEAAPLPKTPQQVAFHYNVMAMHDYRRWLRGRIAQPTHSGPLERLLADSTVEIGKGLSVSAAR